MAGGIKIADDKELDDWLNKRQRNVSVVFAARAALRVLPLIQLAGRMTGIRGALILPIFRGEAISWSASKCPTQEMDPVAADVRTASRAIADTAARAAAAAAAFAVDAVFAAHAAIYAGRAAASAGTGAAAYYDTGATFWFAVASDAAFIELGQTAFALADAPLWPNASPQPPYGVPEQLWPLWQVMKTALLVANEDWEVWTSWYEDRLAGRVRGEARELAYVRIASGLWDQGPAAVNAEIKRRIEELEPPTQVIEPPGVASGEAVPSIGVAESAPPAPIANVPPTISYGWTSKGTITITAGAQNLPVFPFAGGERDHANRLDASRRLAADIVRLLGSGRYNARREYAETLDDYVRDLPKQPGDGNIILADAHARVLRQMFAAEASVLAPALAAKLKILLEQHIGLRAYYPTVAEFYDSVRTGHLERPLPLDAVQDFIQGVRDNTPDVFEPNVSEALAQTAEPIPEIPSPGSEAPPLDASQPAPPPDPIGEIDPEKSQRLTVASGINSLWDTALQGEKIAKNVEGWSKVIDTLTPPVTTILEYLRQIIP